LLSLTREDKSLIPFASVDPHDPKRIEKLADYMRSGCRGLKLHPILQKFEPTSQECFEILEEYSQHKSPVIFHCGSHSYYLRPNGAETYAAPRNFVKLFSGFPRMKFIPAHTGMFECLTRVDIAAQF
jgi:predicted TIM-barrel fold metal-dependent hydrolase